MDQPTDTPDVRAVGIGATPFHSAPPTRRAAEKTTRGIFVAPAGIDPRTGKTRWVQVATQPQPSTRNQRRLAAKAHAKAHGIALRGSYLRECMSWSPEERRKARNKRKARKRRRR